ncbi:hypothetical protein GCM10022250_20200 [Flavobacterium chungbukense]|uniref:Uncharacterized protein n=1 Tax=Flavobacterium chungbukense TaxID=877464 RepID=A0ABP7Y3D9_9FLAO
MAVTLKILSMYVFFKFYASKIKDSGLILEFKNSKLNKLNRVKIAIWNLKN